MLRVAMAMLLLLGTAFCELQPKKRAGKTAVIVNPKKEPAVAGEIKLKDIEVIGFAVGKVNDAERGIYSNYGAKCFTLSLLGEVSAPLTFVTDGEIEEAETDTGEDLIDSSNEGYAKKTQGTRLSTDKEAVMFELQLKLPSPKAKKFKKLSGYFTVSVADSEKEVDLGIKEFKDGEEGSEYGAVLKVDANTMLSPDASEGGGDAGTEKTLTLRLSLKQQLLKEIKFYDNEGNELTAVQNSVTVTDNDLLYTYTFNELPETGKVVAKVYNELKEYKVEFSLSDTPLFDTSKSRLTSKGLFEE